MPEYTENEIIEGCQNNNPYFQELLYKNNYSLFLKICARYSKDMHDAEQLLQDAYLKIFKSIDGFGFKGSFEGWMKRIVVNNCLDYLKSKQYNENSKLDFVEEIGEHKITTSENDAVSNMGLKDLISLIQKLPPMSKTVFNLFIFDGYAHKEISEILNISVGTSQWHVNNARKTLQEKILKAEENEMKVNNEKKIKL